jgi:hypothetical protein
MLPIALGTSDAITGQVDFVSFHTKGPQQASELGLKGLANTFSVLPRCVKQVCCHPKRAEASELCLPTIGMIDGL